MKIAEVNMMLQSVLQGRLDTFRSGALRSPLHDADFQDRGEQVLYAWGADYAPGNGIMERDASRIPSEEEIDQAIAYFAARKLPFIWWSGAKVLESKGFQSGGILTGIAVDISQGLPAVPVSSPQLKIKIVESEEELLSFTQLAADTFAMNANAAEQWLAVNNSLMKSGEQIHFFAYLDGIPVGTASLSLAPTSAGVWNLATTSEHRKLGIGGALVHAALVEAKKRDYEQVMAILMPKGLAWGVFTKLGFKQICEFPFYVYGVSAEELEK